MDLLDEETSHCYNQALAGASPKTPYSGEWTGAIQSEHKGRDLAVFGSSKKGDVVPWWTANSNLQCHTSANSDQESILSTTVIFFTSLTSTV